MIVERLVVPTLPPNLTLPLPDMQLANSGDLGEILKVHVFNMEVAAKCRARLEAIIKLLDDLRRNSDEQSGD